MNSRHAFLPSLYIPFSSSPQLWRYRLRSLQSTTLHSRAPILVFGLQALASVQQRAYEYAAIYERQERAERVGFVDPKNIICDRHDSTKDSIVVNNT